MRRAVKPYAVLLMLSCLSPMAFAAPSQTPQTRLRLPWENLKRLLNLDGQDVRLSWSEFQTLLQSTDSRQLPRFSVDGGDVVLARSELTRLIQSLLPPDGAIPNVYITKAAYQAVVVKDSLQVRADFQVHVRVAPGAAPVSIDLFPSWVAFEEVSIDGQPASLKEENGRLWVAARRQGTFPVRLRFSVRVPNLQAAQALSFPIARTPMTQLDIRLPQPGLEVKVDGALETSVQTVSGGTQVRALLAPAEQVSLAWTPMLPDAQQGPAKVYADFAHLLAIEDDAARVHTTLSLQVLQNTITGLSLAVPPGFSVIDVQGEGLGEWKETAGRSNRLEIPFASARKGHLRFVITSEQIFTQNKVSLPFSGFQLPGAVREKGFIGVELRGAAEATLPKTEGVERVDIQELPVELLGASNRPLLYGFRYLRHPFRMELAVERHEPLTVVSSVIDEADGLSALTEEGKWVHRVTYTLRNSWKQFLEISLPSGARLWSAFVDGRPVKPLLGTDNRILIPLSRSAWAKAASFPVELVFYQEKSRLWPLGFFQVEQPKPDMLISRLNWRILAPTERRYFYWGRSFDQVSPEATIVTASAAAPVGRTSKLRSVSGKPKVASLGYLGQKKEDRKDAPLQSVASPAVTEAMDVMDKIAEIGEYAPASEADEAPEKAITVAGVLPIRVAVSETGLSYQFTKTLPDKDLPLRLGMFYLSERILWGLRLAFAALMVLALYRWRALLWRWLSPLWPRRLAARSLVRLSRRGALAISTLLCLLAVYAGALWLALALMVFLMTLTRWLLGLIQSPEGRGDSL